jgi:hypothetical protein
MYNGYTVLFFLLLKINFSMVMVWYCIIITTEVWGSFCIGIFINNWPFFVSKPMGELRCSMLFLVFLKKQRKSISTVPWYFSL